MTSVSVLILTWNGKRFLKECLDSLTAQTFRDFEIILVDNGSNDDSATYVRENYPWVRLLELPENLGFSGGNNRGFAKCVGKYIVTLNNDTKAEPGFIEALVDAAESDKGAGMVAAKMLNFYEPGRIDSVGVKITSNGLGCNIGVGEADRRQYDKPAEVFGPCAGAALYRRKMLDEVGFFDPDFFAYYEDVDLAWRGRLAGWRCVTAPRAVVYHVHSATSGKMSPFTVYQVHRNKWYVILKNWPITLILKNLAGIFACDLASFILALLRGRIVSAAMARMDFLRDLPKLLKKRKVVQDMRGLADAELALLLSPSEGVFSTFARKMWES
jgi:GT2 family glycosyltransferase